MDLQKIKFLAEQKKIGVRKLAADAGMSEQNLHRCVRTNTIQAADLEKIARVLGVSVGFFFGEQGGNVATASGANSVAAAGNGVSVTRDVREERIAYLEELLREKERLIQVLMSKTGVV